MRPEQMPYGVKDFRRIRLENRHYAADPRIPRLSGGTPVRFIRLEFVGREMRVGEEVSF